MQPDEEEATELFLTQFKTAPIDKKIFDTAGRFFRKWHPSHGVDINDTLLASIAVETGGHIFTLNKKHYPMPEVIVKKAVLLPGAHSATFSCGRGAKWVL
jgi:predicted nucleic acid-binding protein